MTQRSRRRQRHRGGVPSKLLFVAGGVLVVLALVTIGVASWVLDVAAEAPSLAACKPIEKGGNTTLYAGDGSKLGIVESDEARAPVSIDRIPKSVQRATVAIEDERFFEHGGIDPEAIARAALKNLEAGKTVEGGSTITQQLVRNLCIENPTRDLERKIIEAKLAIEYAERHSQAGDPRPVPQHRLLRDDRGQHRGRRSGRLEDLLLQAGLGAEPGAGGAAGRAAAGAHRLQPSAPPEGGAGPPQRGADEDGQPRLHLSSAGATGPAARARLEPRPRLLRQAPALLLRLRRRRADRDVRGRRRCATAGSTSTRRSTRGCRKSAWKRCAPPCPTRQTPPRRWSRSIPATATSRRWSPAPATTRASSTSPPRGTASPARPSRPSS